MHTHEGPLGAVAAPVGVAMALVITGTNFTSAVQPQKGSRPRGEWLDAIRSAG